MGTPLPHNRIRELLDLVTQADNGQYRVVQYLNEHGAWAKTLANDRVYVLLQATLPDTGPERTFLQVHAGGAHGCRREGKPFELLCTRAWQFEYGGPWAALTADGAASFGWRLLVPSDILCEENASDFFGFLLGMVDNIGAVARQLATELVPVFGGHVFDEAQPNAFANLLAGLMPPD